MKIIKNEVRPIGYVTVELNEIEIQTILSMYEELCYIKEIPFDGMYGTRQELYQSMKEALSTNPNTNK